MTTRVLLIDDDLGAPGKAELVGRLFGASRVIAAPSGQEYWRFEETINVGAHGRGASALEPTEIFVCTGQREELGRRQNSVEVVEEALGFGWPHDDKWRWALAIVDLIFNSDPPQERDEYFGHEVLEIMKRVCPELSAAVFTDKSGPEAEQAVAEVAGGTMAELLPKRGDAGIRERLRDILRRQGLLPDMGGFLVGQSLMWMVTLRYARQRAGMRGTLLLGPKGSGKEGVAHYIHDWSAVRGPFMKYSLAAGAGDPQLVALFGSKRGTSTDLADTRGIFEAARGGTVFLDEIHNCDLDAQNRLLRVLDKESDGKYRVTPIGDNRPREVDVRTVAATNLSRTGLFRRMEEKTFKDDLYDRLNGYHPIVLPDLRERLDDLPLLVEYFVRSAERESTEAVTRDIQRPTLDRLEEFLLRADASALTMRWLRDVLQTAVVQYPRMRFLLPDHVELGRPQALSDDGEPKRGTPAGFVRSSSSMRPSPADAVGVLRSASTDGVPFGDLRGILRRGEEAWARLSAAIYVHAWMSQAVPQRKAIVSDLAGTPLSGTKVSDQLLRWASLWEKYDVDLPDWLKKEIEDVAISRKRNKTIGGDGPSSGGIG